MIICKASDKFSESEKLLNSYMKVLEGFFLFIYKIVNSKREIMQCIMTLITRFW